MIQLFNNRINMYKIIKASLLLLLFISCSTNNKEIDSMIVNFSGESSSAISDLLSVSYLKLETRDNCLLGGISQCSEIGEYYILLDNITAKALYVFKLDGSFVQQIGTKGNGPGEYINPLHMP